MMTMMRVEVSALTCIGGDLIISEKGRFSMKVSNE